MITKKKFVIIFILFAFSSCNGIVEKVDRNIVNLERKIDSADSLLNMEIDRIQQLDSLVDKELNKVDRINSLIQDKVSKIDSLLNKK